MPSFAAQGWRRETGQPLLLSLFMPDVVPYWSWGPPAAGMTALAPDPGIAGLDTTRLTACASFSSTPSTGFACWRICPTWRAHHRQRTGRHQPAGGDRTRDGTARRAGINRPPIVIAIDELGRPSYRRGSSLDRLPSPGLRSAGARLDSPAGVYAKPSASLIGSSMKANFPVRSRGTVASRDEARYATGIADSGAEKPRAVR